MDNDQLAKMISSIGILKQQFIGSFAAEMIPDFLRFLYATPKAVKDPVLIG